MPYRIEFCGVPGSGKSTLSTAVASSLRRRQYSFLDRQALIDSGIRRRDYGLIGKIVAAFIPSWQEQFLGVAHSLNDWHQFVTRYPEFAALIHEWIAVAGMDETWRSCVYYAILTTVFEYRLSLETSTTILMDEGFAQRFFTLRGYRGIGVSEDAAGYANLMPRPDLLILLNTPPDICAKRLSKRDCLPLLLLQEPDCMVEQRLCEGSKLLSTLANELEKKGITVYSVVGDGDTDEIVRHLAKLIERPESN